MKTLYINGKIFTPNGFKKCLLVEYGVIKEIYDVNKKITGVKTVNLKNNVLIPGFNDSHCHLFSLAKINSQLVLNDVSSIDEIIIKGKKFIDDNPGISFVFGRGYNDDLLLEKRILRKTDLDKISKEIPIIITRVCGHVQTINSKAIDLLGLKITDKIAGGEIEVFGNELSGVLYENAMNYTEEFFPLYEVSVVKTLLLKEINKANTLGLTSIQTNDINVNDKNYTIILNAYKELLEEGNLNIRITLQSTFNDIDEYIKFKYLIENNDFLKIGPLKIFLDGSLGAQSAYMKNPYKNDKRNFGISCYTNDDLYSIIKKSREEGVSIIAHAIGDAAVEQFLDCKEKVYGKTNPNRLGLVHCQITNEDLLFRIGELNVLVYAQPIFIDYDMDILNLLVDKKTANSSYAFNTLNKKTIVSFGTDAPVESLNCFKNIFCAVTRYNLKQTKQLNPSEAFTVNDAIKAYTYNSAFMSFDEGYLGLIKEGYAADFIILSKDIFTIDTSELQSINILRTVVGGKEVYIKE
ncbi:MAG: amidohydrolase [Bacilli bacterium]|nr:amidohydrolase [Bacilli bacterium]